MCVYLSLSLCDAQLFEHVSVFCECRRGVHVLLLDSCLFACVSFPLVFLCVLYALVFRKRLNCIHLLSEFMK